MQKLAFDIGCNIGKYSLKLLELGWNVIAIDPNPSLFIDPPTGIKRVIKACSDNPGIISFYFCNVDTISTASLNWVNNSRFSNDYYWQKNDVSSTTIDDLVNEFGCPDHIKIDVEGYELTVIKGMTKKYSNEICFEWAEEQGDEILDCVKYLYTLGYKEFGYIFTDIYLDQPSKYYSIDEFLCNFKYDKNRKHFWGMIWAK